MWTKEQEEILQNMEKTQKKFWNIARSSANFLNMFIKICNVKNMLEIGTSNGYSGLWFANALKQTRGKLTTIEYYEKRIAIAQNHFEQFGYSDIISIKQGSALDVLKTINEKIDFAFIDANKREYIEYFKLIDPLLKNGGIIAADNVNSHREKVEDFITAISENPNYQSEILDLPAGLLIARKEL